MFTYSTHNNESSIKIPATSIKIVRDIRPRNVVIDLEAIASFTCLDILIEVSTYKSIFLEQNDQLDKNLVYNRTHSLQDMQTLEIDKLQPCTIYRLKISMLEEDKHVEIYNQNFKTELGVFDGSNDTLLRLEKSEVILEINNSSFHEGEDEINDKEQQSIKLTWADRCVESYKVNLCRIPLECMHDRITSLSTKLIENEVI